VGDPHEWLNRLDHRARLRGEAGLTRTLRAHGPAPDGVTDLAGNDYLGLAHHPEVVAAATKALADYGLGATGSRLVRGSTDDHAALEHAVAALLQQPKALVYSSGYLANLGAIKAMAAPRTTILIDAHAHASLHDGCRLSGAPFEVVPHADPLALKHAIGQVGDRPVLVVTESVFSVDGDLAPLAELHEVCRAAGALLLVDDAHALGVRGPAGAGAVVESGLHGQPDVVVTATLSKAVGAAGGVVAGPASLVGHLVDTGRTFIYDTALPPSVAAGALAGIALLQAADDVRATLHERAAYVVRRVRDARLEVSDPAGGVVAITARDAASAMAWASACAERGVAVGCFRPPSTPDHRSRLRLTINAGIAKTEFERAVDVVIETAPAGSW